ncbi:MAG: alternative ribosome rescue aminoacyl-tRNA hydrolase ArfB [Nocardioidaceae bacterium]
MPGPLHVRSSLWIPERELRWKFSRAGGPGGQSVNTGDTRVQLSFNVAGSSALDDVQRSRALDRLAGRLTEGVLTVTVAEHRSQWRNRLVAEQRLATLLREATQPPGPIRRPTKPTRAARRRRLEAKRRRAETKRLRRARGARDWPD